MLPRKDEVDLVAALLDDEGYTDAQSMARAIVSQLGDKILERECYAVWAVGAPLMYGPYWTSGQAVKAWGRMARGVPGRIVPVRPWSPLEDKGTGCVCGHQRVQHVQNKGRTGVRDCGVPKCGCGQFKGV